MRKLLIAMAAMLTLTATSLAEVKVAEAPPKHSALFAHGMAVGRRPAGLPPSPTAGPVCEQRRPRKKMIKNNHCVID